MRDYIPLFLKACSKYLSEYDPRIFIAQARAESNLISNIVSRAGAIGMMQIMPSTGQELGLSREDLFDPEKNIDGGIRYMRKMIDFWISRIPDSRERLYFALASYNAGAGNIHKAYKRAKEKGYEYRDWGVISALVLPRFTGKFSMETINYVARVKRFYRELSENDK